MWQGVGTQKSNCESSLTLYECLELFEEIERWEQFKETVTQFIFIYFINLLCTITVPEET